MTNDLNSLVDEVQKDDDENLIDVEATWQECWEMIEKEVRGEESTLEKYRRDLVRAETIKFLEKQDALVQARDLMLPEDGDDEEC